MSEQHEQVDRSRRFTGRLLMTVGVLIVLVASTCTGFYPGYDSIWYFVGIVISGGAESEGVPLGLALGILLPTLAIAGLPLLVGILLIQFGRKKLRRSAIKSNAPDD